MYSGINPLLQLADVYKDTNYKLNLNYSSYAWDHGLQAHVSCFCETNSIRLRTSSTHLSLPEETEWRYGD